MLYLDILSHSQGETLLGKPNRSEKLGSSEIPFSIFFDFVLTLGETKYKPGAYNLKSLNGNNFTDDLAQFLCGVAIPKYILHLPHIVYESPIGEEEVLPLIEQISPEGKTVGGKSVRSSAFLSGYVPKAARQAREDSPELQELQAQIDALKANQRCLDQKREQLKKYKKSPSPSPKSLSPKVRNFPEVDICSPVPYSEELTPGREESLPLLSPVSKKVSFQDPVPDKSLESSCYSQDLPELSGLHSRSPSLPPSLEEIAPGELEEDVVANIPESVIELSNNNTILAEDIGEAFPDPQEATEPVETPAGDLIVFEETESCVKPSSDSEERVSPATGRKESHSPEDPPCVKTEDKEIEMADQEASNGATAAAVPQELPEGEEIEKPKKSQKPKEPPVTFREFEHTKDFEDLVRTVVTMLNPEEQDRLREMEDWIIKGEGTWVLAEGFNAFLGRILHDKALPSEARVAMLRLFAYGCEQDDIVLILHMDRKDHLVMNYAQEFDRMPIKEQEAVALFFANLFENNSSSEWLLYISEWSHKGVDLSNIRVTTKVAVNALLGDTAALREYGTAIMHNLGTKEVFDDVCTELAMAIMEFFQGKPNEDQVFRCLKALNKFCTIAHREVPQLVKMIGPDPAKFSGMSPRVDELIGAINARLATVPMF